MRTTLIAIFRRCVSFYSVTIRYLSLAPGVFSGEIPHSYAERRVYLRSTDLALFVFFSVKVCHKVFNHINLEKDLLPGALSSPASTKRFSFFIKISTSDD